MRQMRIQSAPAQMDINTAIAKHTLTAGMTVEQCIQSLRDGLGPPKNFFFTSNQIYSDASGTEKYRWYVPTSIEPGRDVWYKAYFGTFQDGKLTDWHTGDTTGMPG